MIKSRIPDLQDVSREAMEAWFGDMWRIGLLFHPDDDPRDIISTKTHTRLFSDSESDQLTAIIESLFCEHGDEVYEAAYPYFMEAIAVSLGRTPA